LAAGCALAESENCLVTVGVSPTRAEVGYGYVETGSRIAGRARAFWVRRFHEKPSATVARRYLAGGRHLWNSGMFVWKTSVFRRALALYAPEVQAPLVGGWASKRHVATRLQRAYWCVPSRS